MLLPCGHTGSLKEGNQDQAVIQNDLELWVTATCMWKQGRWRDDGRG